jgi:hypothetical protein
LLDIEFLISRADRAAVEVGGLNTGREAQLVNGIILAAFLRTLRVILTGEDIARHLSLARQQYPGKRRIRDAIHPSSFRWIKIGMTRLDLAYENSIVV